MDNKKYQNQEYALKYSKEEIKKAGKTIRHACTDIEK